MTIRSFCGAVIDPAHHEFEAERFGWNHMIDHRPALIARCSSVEDVAAAVQYASRAGLQAAARCGGHSVSGASLPEDGLVIDLAGLKDIAVDPEARIARVGGGALLGELDAATQAHGLAVTAGVEPETGVGGLTVGGGIGFLARKLGLTIDNLVSAQVVLADGTVVEASESEHADLFWALRGGGGQFGIVTRFDFALHRVGPEILAAYAYFPLEKAREIIAFVHDFMHSASTDVTLNPVFTRVPPLDDIAREWHGQPCVALVACHFGPADAAQAELQPMLELGDAITSVVAPMPYVDFQKIFAGASPKGGRYYWKSIFVDDLSDDLADVMAEGIGSLPGEYSMIFMESLGGAVAEIGVSDTAFPNRTARYNLGISAGWADPQDDDGTVEAARKLFEKFKRFSDGTVYLNYVDRDEAARARAGFGPNYERLCSVKAQYDPDGVFLGPLSPA